MMIVVKALLFEEEGEEASVVEKEAVSRT